MKKLFNLIAAVVLSISALTAKTNDQFGVNAFYLDFRTQVMTVEALHTLVDELAPMGINAIVAEWEATFPFEEHATLTNQYMFSKQEITDFVEYSASKGIDIIPLQNCFGHSEYILRHNRYFSLREDNKEISMVCPLKHELAKPVFKEIFAEVAALHPSKYFHIGADETFLLGSCAECQKIVAKEGKSRLFVDYVNEMVDLVLEMGKTPVIWADIILKYPELVEDLSDKLIFVDWNYGWDVNRFGDLQHLFDAGVKMWGATALRSGPDDMFLTMWMKHFDNLSTFIPHARKSGYQGMINTSWSTSGVYGHHYAASWEILSMQPVRLPYPTIGFNILLEAYAEAMKTTKPLDSEKFILDYAKRRFGVDKKGAEKLLRYMQLPQETVGRNGKDKRGMLIADVLVELQAVIDDFATFNPKQNEWEYDHLMLMLELRRNYLQYKEVEALFDSNKFRAKNLKANVNMMADKMDQIVSESRDLHERFVELNKNYLKPGQFEALTAAKSEKMEELYLKIKNYQKQLN